MSRPAIPAPPYAGRCNCGAVRYALNARPKAINACHCADCKRATGSVHLLVLHAEKAAFVCEGETQTYLRRADSGREIATVRCAACGVRLYHAPQSAPHLAFIDAGTLDDVSWVIPTSHIWAEQAAPFVQFADDALVIEGQPSDRQILWDRFNEIYPG